MRNIHPVVIRGGFGRNKDKSIESGAFILDILSEKYFDPTDLLVDHDGWFVNGQRVIEGDIHKLGDIFISALAEDNLEDLKIRKRLERNGVSFLGSSTSFSLLAFHKHGAKEVFNHGNIKTPRHRIYQKADNLNNISLDIFRSFGLPVVLKPVSANYSLGVSLAQNREGLANGLENIFSFSDRVLVEEYIRGREISCLILENFRNEPLYVFPLGEIVREGKISDEKIKREGKYGAVFPARITRAEAESIRDLARCAHSSLDLNHYSRADVILSPKGIYLIEVNSSPEINKNSLLHQGLEAGGMSPLEFLEHLINLTLDK